MMFVNSGIKVLMKVVIIGGIVFGNFNLMFFILNIWLILIINNLMMIVMKRLLVFK